MIIHAGILIFWRSKLQTEIVLSAEAEYIVLSAAIREVIPLIQLLKDLKVNCNIVDTPLKFIVIF